MRVKGFNYDDYLMLYQEQHKLEGNFFLRQPGKQRLPKVLKDQGNRDKRRFKLLKQVMITEKLM